MRIRVSLFIILLSSLVVHAQQGRQLVQEKTTATPKRIALVVGNAAYENAPPLKNPANDATDIAKALSTAGFVVDHGVNLNQRRMKAMIREFGQKLRGGGQGLFYFAGHGVQLKGRNYLIPVDAHIESEADVEDQGVDTNLVLGIMDEAGNGLNVVILDACRNNPFARSFRSVSNGLAQMDAPSGTLIAYATAPGSIASDGNARNGLYTQELLKNMLVPGLSIEEVFKRVRIAVRNSTAGKQTPWEASSLTGDFFFASDNKPASELVKKNNADLPESSRPEEPENQPVNSETSGSKSAGVLNGRALEMPEPTYPAMARSVRASGTVSVEVTINPEGRVVNASAISGHVLLRGAAVEAAYKAKFPATRQTLTGVLNYTFNPQ